MHGQGRKKFTEYGVQLREKQKVKRIYGLNEGQFRNSFEKAAHTKGITGENLLFTLERRLDNVVYRLGMAISRTEARHLVRHSHFTVNNRKVNIPSFQIKEGDEVKVREKSQKIAKIQAAVAAVERRPIPSWLELNPSVMAGKVKGMPMRSDISDQIQEQLIVELYSK
jgi:small subunit ribosomal protein S4